MLMCILLASAASYAQTHYDFSSSTTTFTPLTGATTISFTDTDDALSDEITIPFTFEHFGTSYTKVKVSTNGFLNFDVTSTSSMSSNSIDFSFDPIIAPLWDDLDAATGSVSYKTEGVSGSQIFTVQWLNLQWNWEASAAGISFQVKLYEANNKIEFIYRQEAGTLNSASASIGIVGSTTSQFYSLASSAASPELSMEGYNGINVKPASNQVYSFTPGSAPAAPADQASNIIISNLEAESMTISWTMGDGDYRAVFMKKTANASDVFAITDGDVYYSDPYFGDSYAGDGWYTVYNGTGSTVNVTGLQSGVYYQIQVMEYNGLAGNQKYLTSTDTDNPTNQRTLVVTPSEPGSEIFLRHVGTNTVTFEASYGSGTGKAVFMKAGLSGTPVVVDNTTYTGNLEFGSGTEVGTSGWFCIFSGDVIPSDFDVTNLSPGTDYRIAVVDYNGGAGEEKYLVSDVEGNPIQIKTYPAASLDYTFAKSTGTFTELTGATSLDEIETDDILSESIPLGFSFEVSGQSFTEVKVSSNGFITFNPYAPASTATNNLSNTLHTPLAAALWDDLDGENGDASYSTTGSAGSRIFTVEFKNWQWNYSASGTTISFQIKLYESNNKIEFIYRQESGAVNAAAASIGIGLIDIGDFLSLTSSTAAADTSSVTETNDINTKPATGQIFSFTPIKGDQQITFDPIAAKTYGDAAFALSASSTSGLPISYSSSNTNVATISGNMVTIVGTGTISITASQAGNESFNAATSVEQSLVVNKGSQVITFPALTAKVFGDAPFALDASVNSDIALTLVSSNTNVATISGTMVTIVGAGTTTITASQAGNANWNAATSIAHDLVVAKANQTITFDALSNRQYGDGTFLLEGSASSNLSITYTSSDTDVITISGNEVTIVGVGSADITASQAGNANYNAATNVVRSLTVEKGNQVITFEAFGDRKHIGDIIELEATSDSGLPVSYSSSDESVATIDGTTLTVVGGGAANIVASQAGNSLYNAATAVTQEITAYSTQTITFTNPGVKTVGDNAFSLTASASSGLDVSFTTDDANVTINGSQVTIIGAGTVTIVASQSGNDAFEAATSVEQTFCINPAKPTITLSNEDTETPTLTSSAAAGNQWFKDGAAINAATQSALIVTAEGSYTVQATVEGCASAISDIQVIVVTGVEDALSGVTVYPNPVQKSFTVDVSSLRSAKPVEVSILDVSGRQIQTWSGNGKIECNIATYKSGNYLLNIKAGKKIISKQLTKE